jgi:hypothetical protein
MHEGLGVEARVEDFLTEECLFLVEHFFWGGLKFGGLFDRDILYSRGWDFEIGEIYILFFFEEDGSRYVRGGFGTWRVWVLCEKVCRFVMVGLYVFFCISFGLSCSV